MAQLTIVYWRDIPTQVIGGRGRNKASATLAERFMEAVDRAAMRAKLRDTDSYLAEWRRSDPIEVDGDMAEAATALAARLEQDYDDARLAALVAAGGAEPESR